jgi:P pilus assembly protein, pilin FimA
MMKRLLIATSMLSACLPGRGSADATVNFKGTLIEAPPCVVNGKQQIVVDFGNEVMTTRVDGVNYKQPITFTLDCSTAVSSKQKVRISGTAASFDSNLLSTSVTGLGIALYSGGNRYSPGSWINFTVPDSPTFEAVPVKADGVTLSGGSFSALASLVVDYQ